MILHRDSLIKCDCLEAHLLNLKDRSPFLENFFLVPDQLFVDVDGRVPVPQHHLIVSHASRSKNQEMIVVSIPSPFVNNPAALVGQHFDDDALLLEVGLTASSLNNGFLIFGLENSAELPD